MLSALSFQEGPEAEIQLAEDFPVSELAPVLLRFDEHGGSGGLLLRGLEE